MLKNGITDILSITAEKVIEMADSCSVSGKPLVSDGTTVIPYSKVSCGFCGGSSTIDSKKSDNGLISGAGGAKSYTPVSFLVIKNGEVSVVSAKGNSDISSGIINAIPKIIKKLKNK